MKRTAAFLCLIGGASATQAATFYSVSGIETVGGGYATQIQSINDSGWITGSLFNGSETVPFFSDGTGVTVLGDGLVGAGGAINNNGWVGGSFLREGSVMTPFLYDGADIIELAAFEPNVQGSAVYKLNDQNDAVLYGFSVQVVDGTPGAVLKNFIYDSDANSFTDVASFNEIGPLVFGINNLGALAGTAVIIEPPTAAPHAVIFEGGGKTVLPNFGTMEGENALNLSVAHSVNDAGQATGLVSSDEGPIGFFYDGAQMHSLGTLASDPGSVDLFQTFGLSNGRAINEAGVIVGESAHDGDGNPFHAFVYKDGAIADLNDLIEPDSGWDLNFATDINEFGQIVGRGTYNGEDRGFVLTPYSSETPGESAENPLLGTEIADGSFEFTAEVEVIGQTLFFDPLVATGYDFTVEGSLFTSAIFTSPLDDPDGYQLYSADGLTFLGSVLIGDVFNFGTPLDAFQLRGIAPQNLLDPDDQTAFVSGFQFSSIGPITVTQTAFVENYEPSGAVPEPASWMMMIAGLGAVGAGMRKGKRQSAQWPASGDGRRAA